MLSRPCIARLVKNLPAMQETQVQFLHQEDPLEQEMAIHTSILAWRIPMVRGAWRVTVHGVTKNWTYKVPVLQLIVHL